MGLAVGMLAEVATRQDLFLRERVWNTGQTNGDKGIYRQLIAITKRCGVSGSYFCPSVHSDAGKHFYDNGVIRPLDLLCSIILRKHGSGNRHPTWLTRNHGTAWQGRHGHLSWSVNRVCPPQVIVYLATLSGEFLHHRVGGSSNSDK
jgi:hypothetical protein